MKKIFAAVIALLFAASTSVFAAKHMPGEKADDKKGAKAEAKKDDKKGAKDAKAEAKKDDMKKDDKKGAKK